MYLLLTDRPFTRRKHIHHVVDHHGDVVWSGPNLGDAIGYLVEEEQTTFCVHCTPDETMYEVSIIPWQGKTVERMLN